MVVDAHLSARVMGVRLLRIDGTVLLSPAQLEQAGLLPEPAAPELVVRPAAAVTASGGGEGLGLAGRLLRDSGSRLQQLR